MKIITGIVHEESKDACNAWSKESTMTPDWTARADALRWHWKLSHGHAQAPCQGCEDTVQAITEALESVAREVEQETWRDAAAYYRPRRRR